MNKMDDGIDFREFEGHLKKIAGFMYLLSKEEQADVREANNLFYDLRDMQGHLTGPMLYQTVGFEEAGRDHTIQHILRWLPDALIYAEIKDYWSTRCKNPPLAYFIERHLQGIFSEKSIRLSELVLDIMGLISVCEHKSRQDRNQPLIGLESAPPPPIEEPLHEELPEVIEPAYEAPLNPEEPVFEPVIKIVERVEKVSEDEPPADERRPAVMPADRLPINEAKGEYVPYWDTDMTFFSFISKNKKKAKEQGFDMDRKELGDYYRQHFKKKADI